MPHTEIIITILYYKHIGLTTLAAKDIYAIL